MDLRKALHEVFGGKQESMQQGEMGLDTFGRMMDEVIARSSVRLSVGKRADTRDWYIEGAGYGPVMDFYILLNAVKPIYIRMLDEVPLEDDGGLADALCELLRGSLKEALEEREEAEPDAQDDADGGAEAPGRVGG